MKFFRHFTIKTENKSTLPDERLSCLYIQWCAYMDAIWRRGIVEKTCLHTEISYMLRGSRVWKPPLGLFCPKKNDSLRNNFISDEKMLLLTGKIWKAHKVRNLFLFTRLTKLAHA